MKKLYSLLLLGGLLFFGVQSARADYNICWTAVNVNTSWYYCRSNMDWCKGGAFDGANLGNITSLSIGGQAQWWDGTEWGNTSTMIMGYKIDNGEDQSITLTKYKFENSNNFFQSGGSSYAGVDIDISGLAAGKHTISIWYKITKDAVDYWDSKGGSNYVATFYIPSSVTLNSFGYATFCGANNFEVSGATAYKASLSPEGDVLNLSSISGVIPAGVGIILGGTAGATATISYTGEDATSVSGNVLRGTTSSQTTTSLYSEGQTFYAYDKSDNKFKIYNGTNFPANKAYFIVESGAGSAPSAIRIEFEENNATSIDAIEANEKAVKFIENGKLLILKDGVVYDATGRVVR